MYNISTHCNTELQLKDLNQDHFVPSPTFTFVLPAGMHDMLLLHWDRSCFSVALWGCFSTNTTSDGLFSPFWMSGCCWLCVSPFLNLISPLLRFDNEKNKKSRKRYMHLHRGSVSAIYFSFEFHKTNSKIIRWLAEMHQYTSIYPRFCFFYSWIICCF